MIRKFVSFPRDAIVPIWSAAILICSNKNLYSLGNLWKNVLAVIEFFFDSSFFDRFTPKIRVTRALKSSVAAAIDILGLKQGRWSILEMMEAF